MGCPRQDIRERQQGRKRMLEGGVERRHLAGRSSSDGARVVAVLHLGISVQVGPVPEKYGVTLP